MELSAERVEEIRIAALIHDVGKISVPTEILVKPGGLSPMEFELIKGHSGAGYRILASTDLGGATAEIVLEHHERCDGSGYPRGLTAGQLLQGSKVIMVADVVEAMSSHRPYRAALGIGPALAEIERGAGLQYDSEVAESCARVFEAGFAFSEHQLLHTGTGPSIPKRSVTQ
jgi:HD-GYP domain-containing protein (c-di-GMP phosphodiesterase class II)